MIQQQPVSLPMLIHRYLPHPIPPSFMGKSWYLLPHHAYNCSSNGIVQDEVQLSTLQTQTLQIIFVSNTWDFHYFLRLHNYFYFAWKAYGSSAKQHCYQLSITSRASQRYGENGLFLFRSTEFLTLSYPWKTTLPTCQHRISVANLAPASLLNCQSTAS